MLFDFEQIEQEKLLKNIKCPVLIIHGNSKDDEEELQLLSLSRKAMNILPKKSQLEIIEGAKHGISEKFNKVIELACEWVKENLEL